MGNKSYTIVTLGSHSALQILKGAKDEGFPALEKELIKRNTILIPHGSFVAYLGMEQNKKMKVLYFGNKAVLDWEENRKMQRTWMEKSGIKVPHRFRRGDKIDRAVIVKSYGAAGGKGYFTATNQKEFDR